MFYLALLATYLIAAAVYLPGRIRRGLTDGGRAAGDSTVPQGPLAEAPPAPAAAPTDSTLPVTPASAALPAAVSAPQPVPVDSSALEHDAISRFAHGPLARVLRRRASGPESADRIASALVKEAKRLKLAPSLLAAVLITENPELHPGSVSSQGATGLMQVMPFHAGEYGCASDDLLDPETNICHGARIFGQYLKRTGNVRTALLRYNGCVKSTNTPRCDRYPDKVLRLAGKVRQQLLKNAAATRVVADSTRVAQAN